MPEPLLVTVGLSKRYDGLAALDGVDLSIDAGELHAVIGPNGAGKTTLIASLAGELRSDSGSTHFAGEDISNFSAHARAARGLGRSFQVSSIFNDLSVIDNVSLAVQACVGHSFRFWRATEEDAALRKPALQILSEVHLSERASVIAADLAHGEKRALEMAMVLAARPRLLLLDEPMAGMGLEDAARMVELLASLKRSHTILLVEHDMDTVFDLADRVSVLVYGRVIATGSVAEIRNNEAVRRAYLGDEDMLT
jgi:branched-chain amino acid transport system ATP-binding protein